MLLSPAASKIAQIALKQYFFLTAANLSQPFVPTSWQMCHAVRIIGGRKWFDEWLGADNCGRAFHLFAQRRHLVLLKRGIPESAGGNMVAFD